VAAKHFVNDLAERLRGSVIPAVPVPFGPSRELDESAMRRYAHWMAQQRVGAVALWAHTGRGLLLSPIERSLVLDVWREALAATPIICGVGTPQQRDLPKDPAERTKRVIDLTVAMAESAKTAGAAGVLVYPPTSLRGLPDRASRVLDLHRAVAAVGLPAIAFYLYEDAGGVPYPVDTVAELLDTNGIIGIKLATLDSVMTFQDVAATVSKRNGKLLISGEDRFLAYSFMLGADAALIGMAAACTDRCIELADAWFDRDLNRFVQLAAKIDEFARSTFARPLDGYVQRMLWALEADGVFDEEARDPFGPEMEDSERNAVRQAVSSLRRE
jgi:4-hydroxy-tetrahydrodipicolinate synthase